MYPKNRLPTHPGEVLLEEFLIPMNISQVTLGEAPGDSDPTGQRDCEGKTWHFS